MDNDGTWTEIQNLNGSKFTITNASFKRYRCIAMNVVRGKTHNATSHEFHVKNIDSGKSLACSFCSAYTLSNKLSTGCHMARNLVI